MLLSPGRSRDGGEHIEKMRCIKIRKGMKKKGITKIRYSLPGRLVLIF